jgi:YD repeat-containing protein
VDRVRSCDFPSAATLADVANLDGPVTHLEYTMDGELRQRREQANKADTGSLRVWDYETRYVRNTGTAQNPVWTACTPPGSGCEREDHEISPRFNATDRTRTVRHFDSAGRAVFTEVGQDDGTRFTGPVAKSTTVYRELGRVDYTETPEGVRTTYGYDDNGNVTTTTPEGQGARTTAYDKRGRVTRELGPAVTDGSGATVRSCVAYQYDRADRVVLTQSGTENPAGGCTGTATMKLASSRTVHDLAGRARVRVVDSDGDGQITDFAYNPATNSVACRAHPTQATPSPRPGTTAPGG